MKLRHIALPALLLVAAVAADAYESRELSPSERERAEKRVAQIPIETTRPSSKEQELLRREGKPVPRTLARPGFVLWTTRSVFGTSGSLYNDFRKDLDGCVVVSFEILPDGKTDQFEIEKSIPRGLFDKAALRAAYATEYEPQAALPAPRPRHRKAYWFLIAAPPPSEAKWANEINEAERDRVRETQRASCEALAP